MDQHPVLDALTEERTTEDKRKASFFEGIDLGVKSDTKEPITIPGIDVAAIQKQVGIERGHWPEVHRGCFRVPKDIYRSPGWQRMYFDLRDEAVRRWLHFQDLMGFELVNLSEAEFLWLRAKDRNVEWLGGKPIQVRAGQNPAFGLDDSGSPTCLPDQREFQLVGNFRIPKPRVERIELDPSQLEPTVIQRSVCAS